MSLRVGPTVQPKINLYHSKQQPQVQTFQKKAMP